MNRVNDLALAACRLVNTPDKMADFLRQIYADARAHEREEMGEALKGATVIANHASGIIKELEAKNAALREAISFAIHGLKAARSTRTQSGKQDIAFIIDDLISALKPTTESEAHG